MTEQELNKRIDEIMESTKAETGCGRRSGRQYRRLQRVRHMDHLLFFHRIKWCWKDFCSSNIMNLISSSKKCPSSTYQAQL